MKQRTGGFASAQLQADLQIHKSAAHTYLGGILAELSARPCGAAWAPSGGGGCVKSVLYRTLSVRDLYFIFAYIGLNPYYIRAYIARTSD